jgi:hypothetical protein
MVGVKLRLSILTVQLLIAHLLSSSCDTVQHVVHCTRMTCTMHLDDLYNAPGRLMSLVLAVAVVVINDNACAHLLHVSDSLHKCTATLQPLHLLYFSSSFDCYKFALLFQQSPCMQHRALY